MRNDTTDGVKLEAMSERRGWLADVQAQMELLEVSALLLACLLVLQFITFDFLARHLGLFVRLAYRR